MALKVNMFGLFIKANKESYGLVEQIQVVYLDSMAIHLKENIKKKYELKTTRSYVKYLLGPAIPEEQPQNY